MSHPLRRLRIPYTGDLPPPIITPRSANTPTGATKALTNFLLPVHSTTPATDKSNKTLLLTGAGLSVASGLADYRGTAGTYTLNKTYRPIYYAEFLTSHAHRRRYWARSFLGYPTLLASKPNAGHYAIAELATEGLLNGIITQNVDSFHRIAHGHLESSSPSPPTSTSQFKTLELHGFLRSVTCTTCQTPQNRTTFQKDLERLNPAWSSFLHEMQRNGALSTEDPAERAAKGLRTNPDGDVELPVAPFHTFRYPACSACIAAGRDVKLDADGAWLEGSEAGVLKPAVVMFGESIKQEIKDEAERLVDGAARILVLGSSLATFSAWRLVKRARDRGMPVGILNLRGVRGEEGLLGDIIGKGLNDGSAGVRAAESTEKLLPMIVDGVRDRLRKQ